MQELAVAPGVQYQLTAAGSGADCGGNFIQGVVTGANGAPVAGVRVVATDKYGNRADVTSKDGAEAGRFDFGVAGSQNDYYVTVLDGAGNAISATAVLNHVQPQEGNACYWVQFQAAN